MNDALLAPRRTLGRYEILGEIAQGAMGVVYKARDPLIDRVVAIKTVNIGLSNAETEAFERRFFREAKSAGRLNHPNVVTIHDVGKTEDIAYIAMEFLDGHSLREILDSGVVLPPERIADIAAEIAEGLAFAHRNQVVHRDVKPANIMVLDERRGEDHRFRDRAPARRERARSPATCSARRAIRPRSRSWGGRSMDAPTSSRSVRSSTRC